MLSVSHLLHTWWPSHLRAFLDKLGNVEGKVLHCLVDLNVVLPSLGRPDAVVVFLQPSQQPHPGLRVRPTPVRTHPLFPQILPGLIPVSVKECANLLQMTVFNSGDILSQLLQSELRLGFAVGMVKDMHQLPDNIPEAVHKTLLLLFQLSNGPLFLTREITC